MSILFALLTLLGGLFVLLLILGYFLPTDWTVEKAVLVEADVEEIFPFVNVLENWQEWTVWNAENEVSLKFEGPASGVAATQYWTSSQIKAKMTVSKVKAPSLMEFDVELEQGKFLIQGILALETSMPSVTQVAWRSQITLPKGINPVWRYQAFFLKNYIDSSMQNSLMALQGLFNPQEKS